MTVYHYGLNADPHELWYTMLHSTRTHIGVDTETHSVADITMLGLGISDDPDDAFYITTDDEDFPAVVEMLQNPVVHKIHHNAPFDLRVLRQYNVDIDNVDDTALMARLYPEPSAVLEDVSFWVNRQTQSMKHVFEAQGVTRVTDLPQAVLAEKCCKDSMATRALYDYYAGLIDMDYYEWIRPMYGILTRISRQGILLDQDRLNELNVHYGAIITRLRQECTDLGFSVSSPAQVGDFLARRGNWLPVAPAGKQLVSDDEHLAKMDDPVAKKVLEFRHASKMESTYIRPFLGRPRAYTTLRMEAGTGRVNSTNAGKNQPDRNLQNIPKQAEVKSEAESVRGAFIPDSGTFTKLDQSQGELRITADLSQDKNMIDIFARDEDMHQWVVNETGLSRTQAKNLSYGIGYGGDDETIANFLHMSDLAQVRYFKEAYRNMFPQAWDWYAEQEERGMRDGIVYTKKGRPLLLPAIGGEKHLRNCARNYSVQGTAFEAMTDVMLDPAILKYLDITRLQVHDELIFDGDIEIEGMVYNEAKTAKEGHPTWDIRGRLAWLSGFYAPLEVQKVTRWG